MSATIAWSFGGGIQTAAIGVLIREGVLPVPELSVIADTGRERQSTWDYLRDVMQPYLAPVGVKIEVAPHSLARVDLYARTSELPLVPAYTRVPARKKKYTRPDVSIWDGVEEYERLLAGEEDAHDLAEEYDEGRLPTYCSGEWKRDVCERWLRLQGVSECDVWIGYSLDEQWRVKKDHRPWCRYRHPLIDLKITRETCGLLIQKAGLPLPQKSRCYDCPHQSPREWLEVKSSPREWALAVERDELIRANDAHKGLFLYSGRVPLALADFEKDAGLAPPAKGCDTGSCWT